MLTGAVGFSLAGGPATILGNVDLSDSAPATVAAKAQPASDGHAISGRAAVIDGDTIDIAGTRVRFNGIDAPESAQLCRNAKGKNYRCGQAAAKALDAWLAKSRPVACTFIEWDRYGRFVGDCQRADGASVAAWLVSAGHAMDWPRHSNGAYASHQAEAQAAKRGIWQGKVQPPWEWRSAQRAPEPETSSAPIRLLSGSCDIKGNISNKGQRIYHVPGQRFYNETVISSAKGERMFCSEEGARSAGWRRAKS
jgi:endonuclease YncB( thermonuclease family)